MEISKLYARQEYCKCHSLAKDVMCLPDVSIIQNQNKNNLNKMERKAFGRKKKEAEEEGEEEEEGGGGEGEGEISDVHLSLIN